MTQQQLEYIINSDLPANKKSELIKGLYDAEHEDVLMFKDGGKTKEEKADDELFEEFKETLPDNLKNTPEEDYHTRLSWELHGKPKNFEEALKDDMYAWDESDQSYHGNSIAWGEDGIGYFLKPKHHDTVKYELDWFNNGVKTEEGGQQHKLTGEELDFWRKFRNKYRLDDSGEDYKYIPIQKQGGTLDMTLEDILKLNISDSAKEELTRAFAEGGSVEEDKSLPEPDTTVTVGDREYQVCIADTPEKRKEGLSKCKELPEDGGMLFIFEELSNSPFTMAETSIDLDIIFIDEEGEVIEVISAKGGDLNPVQCREEYAYVLEVNYGSGVREGDEVSIEGDELSDEEKGIASRSKMLVLDENGDVQMKLVGGERIISIIGTKKLIKLAVKAFKSDAESDYRAVGRFVMKEFAALDLRTPQYVEAPEKKGENNGE